MSAPRPRRFGYASRALVLATAVVAMLATPLEGQDRRGRRGPPQDRQQMQERIRAEMARMIQERLELTDVESATLGEVMERFQEQRRELWRSEQATRRSMEAFLLEGPDDEGQASALLERLVELRAEESRLFQAEQQALLELLTPTQVLRLHALREDMARRIRALRGGRGGGPLGGRVDGAARGWPGRDWRPGPAAGSLERGARFL